MTAAHTFTSPVGRLVGGDVFTARDKDFDGRPMTTRDGNPRSEYIVQIAFPKTDPATEEMRGKIYQAAMEGFPTLFQNGQCLVPTFSYKWTDGDSQQPNMRGVKPCDKEGFPGHWVLTFKSSFAPKVYGQNQEPVADPKAIKRGDWVRVGCVCRGNGQQNKPGVYLNHSMLQLCGYGEELASGPDAATVFADPIRLPPGASSTPVAPVGGMPGVPPGAPGAPPQGVPGVPPGQQQLPGVPPPGVPQAPPATAPAPQAPQMPAAAAPGIPGLPPAAAPAPVSGFGAAVPAPAPPPPPAAKQTTPGSPTYESLVSAGWNDEQMKTAGYLA